MTTTKELIEYARYATSEMLATKGVDGFTGKPFKGGLTPTMAFRPTQLEGIQNYDDFLGKRTAIQKRLAAYLEIATGVGKTGLFTVFTQKAFEGAFKAHGILPKKGQIRDLSKQAFADNQDILRAMIVVPTINLLNDVYKAFTLKYAPELSDYIGVYGGTKRQLDKPITIITYASWKSLIEAGKLDGREIDFLISDEAHRSLSERSEQALIQEFSGDTLKLAFTATARYDQAKSVQKTHKNKIISIPISESIRRGELAAYIQTQFHIIRVNPDSAADSMLGRRRARQMAWNDFAVDKFKSGIDQRTGDLLSDNKAGFFVDDTHQADRLGEKLNADKDLAKIAKERGCKGVAVAIHSNVLGGTKHHEKLEEEYKAGKWMAIVGDEKFKEGFDHDKMKTVVDWPHGSLVDKAQILGRGARKWFNEDKNRLEGLTFCDTIVYIGDNDPKEDERLREKAIRNAVIASDILEDAVVLGPETPAKPDDDILPVERPVTGGDEFPHDDIIIGDPTSIPPDDLDLDGLDSDSIGDDTDPDRVGNDDLIKPIADMHDTYSVESYAELKEVRTFLSGREQLIADYAWNYTIEDVLDSARAHLEQELKKPDTRSGIVKYGPLKDKITWSGINVSMGTTKTKEHPYNTLLEALETNGIGASKLVTDYTIEDVIEAARLEVKDTGKGIRPRDKSKIQHGKLKGKTSWTNVEARIRGGKGLVSKYTSLADCLAANKILCRSVRLSIKDVEDSVRKEFAKTGCPPSSADGAPIKYGKLKRVTSWKSVNAGFAKGRLKESGYQSLRDFCAKNKISKKPKTDIPEPN